MDDYPPLPKEEYFAIVDKNTEEIIDVTSFLDFIDKDKNHLVKITDPKIIYRATKETITLIKNDNNYEVVYDENKLHLHPAWQNVRERRNTLMTATDWTVGPDSPLSEEKKAEMIEYRQKLRDITKNTNVHPEYLEFPRHEMVSFPWEKYSKPY